MNKYNDKQLNHIFAIWLYTYGGSTDLKTYDEYVDEYDDNPDNYGNCPCYICQDHLEECSCNECMVTS